MSRDYDSDLVGIGLRIRWILLENVKLHLWTEIWRSLMKKAIMLLSAKCILKTWC